MKPIPAIFFIAALSSGAYASSNLRSRQKNLDHIDGVEFLTNITLVEDILQKMKESLDDRRLLETDGSREITTSEQHEEINNGKASLQESYYRNRTTPDEPDEDASPVEDLRIGLLRDNRNLRRRRSNEVGYNLKLTFQADNNPTDYTIVLYETTTMRKIWYFDEFQPITRYRYRKWVPKCGRYPLRLLVTDSRGDGLGDGSGYMRVKWGKEVLYFGRNIMWGFSMELADQCEQKTINV